MADAIKVCSIADLLSVLKSGLGIVRWFRGHPDVSWELVPGLVRSIPHPLEEQEMMKRFRQRSHLLLDKTPTNSFDWLFWMQHYGVPTRLLDWSESPLAALYFAVEDLSKADRDGALWILDPIALNKYNNISDDSGNYIPSFEDEILKNYSPETLANETKTSLNPIAATATRNNPRIQAQLGVFTIIHRNKNAIEKVGSGAHVVKCIIPASAKENISKELLALRIDRFSLFPEVASIGHNIRRELGL